MGSEAERLRREVQSLTDRLRSVELRGAGSKKRGKSKAKAPPQVPGAMTSISGQRSRSGSSRRRGARNRVAEGEVAFQREELVRTLTLVKGRTDAADYFDLVPGNFEYLKVLSKAFERVQWINCALYWKPAVGTTFGGLVSYAVDWDSDIDRNITRAKLSAYTPVCSHAVWADNQRQPLVLPPSRLMSRTWYLYDHSSADVVDKQPGRIGVVATASAVDADTVLGEIWVKYHVKFSGTKPS